MPGSVLVPVTRATGLGPLPQLLEERAGWQALRKSFAAEKIPLAVVDDKDVLLPLEAMMGLFERAALAAGERTFGLHTRRAPARETRPEHKNILYLTIITQDREPLNKQYLYEN